MKFWSGIFRLAAIVLLLSAALDLCAVDMFGTLWQDPAELSQNAPGGDTCAQDDCFCCCTHVLVTAPAQLVKGEVFSLLEPDHLSFPAPVPLATPSRPPRA